MHQGGFLIYFRDCMVWCGCYGNMPMDKQVHKHPFLTMRLAPGVCGMNGFGAWSGDKRGYDKSRMRASYPGCKYSHMMHYSSTDDQPGEMSYCPPDRRIAMKIDGMLEVLATEIILPAEHANEVEH